MSVATDAISVAPRSVETRVENVARDVLASTTRFAGAGIVSVHPKVLARSRSLLWWVTQRENGGEPLPLDADLTELGTYQAGLEDIEWYRVPATTGRSHMTGPFVDYMCTDQFAFTFTAPLEIDGEFYGVAGIDMTVHSLEDEVESLLENVSDDAMLLANGDLVAISLDPRFATGSRLKPAQLDSYTVTPVAGTALYVAVPH
ncbi:cache domain-containing protein [Brevibacterium marinum]|uniref:Cache domain-containing protein n=1 Tax=Brevibacterium marinum TaxID=418643 RepID=A0A846RR38_9MICO|nr:cache domain-containing protein [Brevibacterium marinum]NJC56454.1 hypothetical protein [Brevibacterium marinum]